MASPKDKFRSLIEGLYGKTVSGNLMWYQFPDLTSVYVLFGDTRLELDDGQNNRGEPIISLTMYNKDGKVIDYFNDDHLKGSKPANYAFPDYYILMSNLYEAARRSATGADKAVDEILKAIEAPKIDSDEVPF